MMPKKKNEETQEDQSKRFIEDVERLADEGDIDLDESNNLFEKVISDILTDSQD